MRADDAFEQSLKRALDQYEAPYNSADWAKLEQALGQDRSRSWQASAGLYALLLGGTLALATTVHLLVNGEPEQHGGAMALVSTTATEDTTSLLPSSEPMEDEPSTGSVVTAGPTKTGSAAPEPKATAAPSQKEKGQGAKREGSTVAPTVTEPPRPVPGERTILVSTTEGCPGTTVDFGLDRSSENGIYLWNFGDGSFSNKARPSHTFSKPGTYEVMLSHSAVGGGNIMNRPVSDRIIIHETPEASFSHLGRDYPNTIPSVHFENRSAGGKTYHWDFGDGNTSNAVHPDHVYKKKGIYQVVLTVINGKGCTDRTEQTIEIANDYDLLAPKTFSPNKDGVDDTFIPEALKTLGLKFTMSIFDPQTGQIIYETSDPQRPWNGRIGNKGGLAQEGDYVWMVEMRGGEKYGGTYNGQVRLLR